MGTHWTCGLYRRLGPVALATQSVLLLSSSTVFQALFALSIASSILIGNSWVKAMLTVPELRLLLMSLLLSGISWTMFLTFRNLWGKLFTAILRLSPPRRPSFRCM
ncbi:hypothetical protein BDZ89DRAFT_326268 [Hymenopellis radicata]|nr:hypothetical protein BDZ89DRAFT_326268 [Hymenopellis radicata]